MIMSICNFLITAFKKYAWKYTTNNKISIFLKIFYADCAN